MKKNAKKAKHSPHGSDPIVSHALPPAISSSTTNLAELDNWFNKAKLTEAYSQFHVNETPEEILEREISQSASLIDLEKALLSYDRAYEEEGEDFSLLLGLKGKNKKKKAFHIVTPHIYPLEHDNDKTLANKLLCDNVAIENQENINRKQNKKKTKKNTKSKLCVHGNPYPKFNKLKESFLADWYDSHSHDESIWGSIEYPTPGVLVEPRELKSNVTITFTSEEMHYLGERNKANQEMLTSYIKRKALEGFTPKAKETQEEEII